MQDTALVTLLYAVTAASSGVNAMYFLRYRFGRPELRRRVGAAVRAAERRRDSTVVSIGEVDFSACTDALPEP
ncbi:MAG: hypothetical protein AAB502_09310, partial [Chloroflexota bacterium]